MKRIETHLTTGQLYALYMAGETLLMVAKREGCSWTTIQRRFKEEGLPIRPLSQAHRLAYQSGRRSVTVTSGKDHWAWKGGSAKRDYRKMIVKTCCEKCQRADHLCIHHKNNDHYDNRVGNLAVYCQGCHQREHKKAWWKAKKAGLPLPKSNAPIGWHRTSAT